MDTPERNRARVAAYRQRHPGRVREAKLRWQQSNPEKVALMRRRHYLKKTFGITLEEYEALSERQGHVCAICHEPETGVHPVTREPLPLAVDHEHESGRVRGLLCRSCNRGLGQFRDNPQILRDAADYLAA